MHTLVYKKICLLNEVETSIKLLKMGMGELQKLSGGNDFYHAPILLLSSGYERLIKCLLCLALIKENGEFIEDPFQTSGKKGHNLDYLLERLLWICEEKKYSSKFPAAKTDIDYLNTEELRKIIKLLSDFAQGGRYYNLDIVLNGKSSFKDPSNVWDEIVTNIFQTRDDLLNQLFYGDSDHAHNEINQILIVILEKFSRALARMFTLADFGEFAKQASPHVYDYLMLMDKDLGKKDYNQ